MDIKKFMLGNTKFLKVQDIDEPVVVEIARIREEELGIDRKEKLVMYFSSPVELEEKCLSLNFTNTQFLIDRFGTDSDSWIGEKIELFIDPDVRGPTGICGGIRFRLPSESDEKIPY